MSSMAVRTQVLAALLLTASSMTVATACAGALEDGAPPTQGGSIPEPQSEDYADGSVLVAGEVAERPLAAADTPRAATELRPQDQRGVG